MAAASLCLRLGLRAFAGALLVPTHLLAQSGSKDAVWLDARLEVRSELKQVRLNSRVPLVAHAFASGLDRGSVRNVRYLATCGTVLDSVLLVREPGSCTITARWTTPAGNEATGSTEIQVVHLTTRPCCGGGLGGSGRKPPPIVLTRPPTGPPPPPPSHIKKAGKPHPAAKAADEEELPQFPWPPPRSTARAPIPRGLVTNHAASAGEADTLGTVADRIEAALNRAGIERAVYAIGDSGFVYVTRTEMIDQTGRPLPPPNRFPADVESASGSHGFLDFIVSRFRARPGFFRIIAIVVTSRPIAAAPEGMSVDSATRMVEGGMATLPDVLRRRVVTGLEAVGLIYEYERRSEAEGVTLRNAPLVSADRHLAQAGLWSLDQLKGTP